MSQTPIYKPQAGSVAHRVLSFLQQNPDEELTRGDIAVKFGASPASIDTLLQLGASRGAFKRGRNKQMEIVWTLGDPATFEIDEAPAPKTVAPVPTPGPAAAPALAQAFGVGTENPPMPFDSPIVENAADLLPATDKTRRAMQIEKYWAWFGLFGVGNAAEFDRSQIRDVAHLAGKYGREAKKEFRCSHGRDDSKAVIVRLS